MYLKNLFLLITVFLSVCMPKLYASEVSPEAYDRSLSPYFVIVDEHANTEQFPLLATDAEVNIAGVIADVNIKQTYKNNGTEPIEAIYVFPASTRAAVYAMTMTIGERTITAKIDERGKARAGYETAKLEGKSASLLEQQRPNVFQMNVANIMPGDKIEVDMSYTELLVPTAGIYEFVYPTVVGPRYSNQPRDSLDDGENWVENPYLHEGEPTPYKVNITANLTAGMPIQDISSATHDVNITYQRPDLARIELKDQASDNGNRDYVLKYRLAGEKVQTGLLLYEGVDENFFLLMAEPPKRVKANDIPPREYIFIVDVSGSMHGFPIETSKKLLRNLITNLKPTDSFNVMLFASSNAVLSESSLPATSTNITSALRFIDKERGGGGTELLPALRRALSLPKTEGTSRTVVIATDGYVTVEKEAFDLIRQNLHNANMFPFGIGSGVNRFIIEGMARAGFGEPFVISSPAEADAAAEKFRNYIATPVLTNIEVSYDGFNTYDIEPISVPDVFAERPIVVFGKWRGKPKGKIGLSGQNGDNSFSTAFDISDYKPLKINSAIRYLWARNRITTLGDYQHVGQSSELEQEITELGLKYSLLTSYTSFIAIDSLIRNRDGNSTTVKQPLPLPKGVTDYAVGRPQRALRSSVPSSVGGIDYMHNNDQAKSIVSEEAAKHSLPSSKDGLSYKDKKEDNETPPSVKKIGSKTFRLQNGVWIDSNHTPELKVIKIKPGSPAYQKLIKELPELKRYLEIGKYVIVVWGNYAVELSDDGVSTLSDSDLNTLKAQNNTKQTK